MEKMRKILALILAVLLLLCGCGYDPQTVMDKIYRGGSDVVEFEDMVYTRPSLAAVETALNEVCEAAEGEDVERIVDEIYEFYDIYDSYYTSYALANIHYSCDITDLYWAEENSFCVEHSPEVEAALEELFYALAGSPSREALEGEEYFGAGYFDSYEGENRWDEEFTALMDREAELENRYYDLSEAALDYEADSEEFYVNCSEEMMELLAELIAVRQEMAELWGYSSYVQFATDMYYYRDYTAAQTDAYLDDIRTELVPLYRQMNESEIWEELYVPTTEAETFRYVRNAAEKMGGTVKSAFSLMDSAGLYDIRYGENKYSTSFEIYLSSYYEPFVFVSPTGTDYDHLTFAHEFGHFCNDYASYGSYAGIDVAEVFSQGMEYLSLCYGEDTERLTRLKLADCLYMYVEQAGFAKFEQEMYSLTGADLTAENLQALYERIAREYGFDSGEFDPREFVTVTHFYTNPMYIISYVVSNDAALQLYQLELEEKGAGLWIFEENLDTEAEYFLEFLDSAGLDSPFEPGRVKAVARTLEEALK